MSNDPEDLKIEIALLRASCVIKDNQIKDLESLIEKIRVGLWMQINELKILVGSLYEK